MQPLPCEVRDEIDEEERAVDIVKQRMAVVKCSKSCLLPGTLSTYAWLSFSHFDAYGRQSQKYMPRLLTVLHTLPVSSKVN